MAKPKSLILTGFGINCNYETEQAFASAGAETEQVHINQLRTGEKNLDDYTILALPGGFAHGDELGAGKALAVKLTTELGDKVQKFIDDGKLVIGICNGFQALVKTGFLPGKEYGTEQTVTLTSNDSGRFRDDWVYLKINPDSPCVWTKGIENIMLPIRHGEGKFVAGEETLGKIAGRNQIAMQYADGNYSLAEGRFPFNPNSSPYDIAGICGTTGRIFGLMPHPEGNLNFTNNPYWTRIADRLRREGKEIPECGQGAQIFRNAVEFVRKNL